MRVKQSSATAWTIEEDRRLERHVGKMKLLDMIGTGLFPGRSVHSLEMRMAKLGLKSGIKRKLYHNLKLDFFKNITPESAYWGGFLAADGCLVKDKNKTNTYRLCLSVSVKDKEHLKLFQLAMGHDRPITHFHPTGGIIDGRQIIGGGMCFINICQAGRMIDDLSRMGVIPDKTKRIPPPALDSNLLKLAWIKGYIDGDGCLSITNNHKVCIGIISSCPAILHWIKAIIDPIFPTSYMDREYSNVNENATESWQYNVNGYRGIRIIDTLSRLPTPELARKWKRPRLLELIAEAKANPSFAAAWAVRLPIEDEIDIYLKKPV